MTHLLLVILSLASFSSQGDDPTPVAAPRQEESPSVPADLQLEQSWQQPNACGADALYYFLRLHHITVDRSSLIAKLAPPPNGNSLEELRRAAKDFGIEARAIKAQRSEFAKLDFPAIVHLQGEGTLDHFVVVLGVEKPNTVHVIDGTNADLAVQHLSEFMRQWTGYALVARSDRKDQLSLAAILIEGVCLFAVAGRLLLSSRVPRHPINP